MKSYFLTLFVLLLFPLMTKGQGTPGAAAIINEIKLSTDYLYAESTSSEWNEARDNALDVLKITVEDWLAEQGVDMDVDSVLVSKQIVRAKRVDLWRAFIYVKKPVAEKSVVAEKPAAAEKSPDAGVKKPSISLNLSNEEQRMLQVKKFADIEPYITGLKSRNLVKDYGKYTSLPEGNAYMFVYNRDGDVIALIKKIGDEQTNLNTGKPDNVKENYKGCGAIWFRTYQILIIKK